MTHEAIMANSGIITGQIGGRSSSSAGKWAHVKGAAWLLLGLLAIVIAKPHMLLQFLLSK